MSRLDRNTLCFFVGVLLAAFVVPAFAAVLAPTGWGDVQNVAGIHSSGQAVCDARQADIGSGPLTYTGETEIGGYSSYVGNGTVLAVGPGSKVGSCRLNGGSGSILASPKYGQYCDAGQWVDGQFPNMQCSACPTGTVSDGGACVEPPSCPEAGTNYNAGMYDLGTSDDALPPTSACAGGCEVTYSGSGVAFRQMIGGVYHYFAEGSLDYNGQECASGPAPLTAQTTVPPITCDPATQDQGEVNGQTVCLSRSDTKTTTTTAPVTNPDNSVTQTETTTDTKTGEQTTTTTTTNPDGSQTKTVVSGPAPGSGSDFCKTHPTDPTCRDPSKDRWGSSGTAKGFGLPGDIAGAKQAFMDRVTEIRGEIAAMFGDAPALGGSIPCESVTVLGKTTSICLADQEETFLTIGSALLAIAYLIALFIMLR